MVTFVFWGFTYRIPESQCHRKYVVLPNKTVLRNVRAPHGFRLSFKRLYVSSLERTKTPAQLALTKKAALAEYA